MSRPLCEMIERIVATMRGVVRTGQAGGEKRLRPFVYAVVDLRVRQ